MKTFQWTGLLAGLTLIAAHAAPSHVVVLMMENRSFDHLLGFLKQDYSSGVDGIDADQSCPIDPTDLSKGTLPVTRGGFDVSPDDPLHDFDSVAAQINYDGMDGFISNAIDAKHSKVNPVSMFDSTSAPIINTLAKEYAVFDRWFCSIPGPTDPNRGFAMAGTSKGILTNFNGTRWDRRSYFDYLASKGKTFGGYYQDDLWALGYFTDLHTPQNSRFIKQMEPNFYKDAASGNLADFVWLQPREVTSWLHGPPTWQHPDASVIEGERLIKKVYEAIRASPQWNDTVLIITYDEHGGFYDHVAPPRVGVPAPDDNVAKNGFTFEQLGIRVPTVVISPLIPKGTIVTGALAGEQPTPYSAFEHTSIMATANKLLGINEVPLGSKRAAWANTFAGLFTLPSPRADAPLTLPTLPPTHHLAVEEQRVKPLNDLLESQLLFYCAMNYPSEHEAGTCPGRKELISNQGEASDFIIREATVLVEKLRHAEREFDKKVAQAAIA